MAKAAFAGKAKAQSAGLSKGRGAAPQGTLRPSEPAPVATRRWVRATLHGFSETTPVPPRARAKGSAAQARAKAAAAGRSKAQAGGLGKGRGALPQGALQPSRPLPVATRRWIRCGWDADYYYDNKNAKEPCPRLCRIDSGCRITATCYEITGRTCTQPSHHQGPHRCGTYHEDALGQGNCYDEEGSDDSGCDDDDDGCKSRKSKGRGNEGNLRIVSASTSYLLRGGESRDGWGIF